MKSAVVLGCWLAMLVFSTAARAAATMPPGVPWLRAASDADIDRAFELARGGSKPVLLYWGASWCPPCNHLKSTLFNRRDFAERARSFVPVFVDGDGAGAQRLGARFKVRGYPTLVLMNTQGIEITRLPGEVDAQQVMAVMQLGMGSGRALKAVVDDARAGRALAASEWRLLAFYAWHSDEEQIVAAAQRASLLAELAARCPPTEREAATRLLLKALAASDDGQGLKPDDATRERVLAVVAEPVAARAQMDVLAHSAPELVKALAPESGAARRTVVATFDAALQRLQADTTLSRADRLSALVARVELARMEQPKDATTPDLPPRLQTEVRAHVMRYERELADGYERQAVVTAAAYLLARAGLWEDSDGLLKTNLAKSHAPYYLMSQLGGNARKLGRTEEALGWYARAWERSEGPATRLQWGSGYIAALVDLAPHDAARIEKAAAAVLAEADRPGSFYDRSATSLQRLAGKLAAWNKAGQHAAAIGRLRAQLDAVCARLDMADPQRAVCTGLLKQAAPPA